MKWLEDIGFDVVHTEIVTKENLKDKIKTLATADNEPTDTYHRLLLFYVGMCEGIPNFVQDLGCLAHILRLAAGPHGGIMNHHQRPQHHQSRQECRPRDKNQP